MDHPPAALLPLPHRLFPQQLRPAPRKTEGRREEHDARDALGPARGEQRRQVSSHARAEQDRVIVADETLEAAKLLSERAPFEAPLGEVRQLELRAVLEQALAEEPPLARLRTRGEAVQVEVAELLHDVIPWRALDLPPGRAPAPSS